MKFDYLGFNENPFCFDPELNDIYKGLNCESVYRQMCEDLRKGLGIVLLIGKEGTGKTLALREISHQLKSEVKCIQCNGAINNFDDLLNTLCIDLELESDDQSSLDKIQSLDNYLSETRQINPRIALLIDDAHRLQHDVLSNVTLLSAPPSDEGATFQIVLSGLPALEAKLEQCQLPSDEQFKVYRHWLNNLDATEVGVFIKRYLGNGSEHYDELFMPEAISRIAEYSYGNPRQIKKICAAAWSIVRDQDLSGISEELIDHISNNSLHETSETEIQIEQTKQDDCSPETNSEVMTPQASSHNVAESAENNHTDKQVQQVPAPGEKSSKQWFAIGTAPLVLIVVLIILFQPNTSDEARSKQTSQLKADSLLHPPLPIGDSVQGNPLSRSDNTNLKENKIVNSGVGQTSSKAMFANAEVPGNTARAYIASLENDAKPVDLDSMYKYAGDLSKQNKPDDVYLLYFYAANRGHGNSAFRLAQMADPATFNKSSTVLTEPSVVEANKWYLQAVKAGHPKAEYYLTNLLSQLIKKADSGDVEAQRILLYFKQ